MTNAIGFTSSYLSKVCRPNTVIDVGVGHGTFPLYEAFPKAHFILIEPLKDYESSIQKISEKYDIEVYYNAVGEKEDQLEINVSTKLQMSSFMDRTSLTNVDKQLHKRTIDVTTLDIIYRKNPRIKGSLLLKIDTEGYELSVLKGAQSMLKEVDAVIAEVSIAKRFEHGYEFEDIVIFMKNNGFYLFSILNIGQLKGEVRPRFADVLFMRHGKELQK